MNKTSRRYLVIASVILLGLGVLIYLKSPHQAALSQGQSRPQTSHQSGNRSVSTTTVIEFSSSDLISPQNRTVQALLPISGTIKPFNQVTIKAKVAGEILTMSAREGESVKAGQVLVQINPLEYQLKLKQAQETLAANKAQLDWATRNLQSNQSLLEKNFISKNAVFNVQTQYDQAKGNYEAALAQLALTQKSLHDATLTTPIAGIIATRYAQAGEKISPDSKLLDVVDLDKMELEASVPVADISKLQIGQTAQVTIEGRDTLTLARIVRIAPSTQAGSRSVLIYLTIDNADHTLKAGMFAQGGVVLQQKENALVIPASALRQHNNLANTSEVYVINQGQLASRVIKTGLRNLDNQDIWIEVLSGLQAQDVIIRNNVGVLNVGSPVNIVTAK